MNVHDSEKIAGILSETGYRESDNYDAADVIVLNTCSIRDKAEHKFYSELGRLKKAKKHNPDLKIAVAGCIARQKGDSLFKRFPYVDFIFGPNNIDDLQNWVQTADKGLSSSAVDDNPDYHTKHLPVKREGRVSAWVSIMYGCDNFCSYCVVPYTRGRERSRPADDIYKEVKGLAEDGFKEITLLGQNVNSYGKKSSDNIDFADLLSKLHVIDGIQRIRFVTSHPKDFSEKLVNAIKVLPKVCKHLHLPIQSGSDRILNSMNRRYTYEEYKGKIGLLRNAMPEIAITSDIIIGFPGETDDDFRCTIKALTEIEYDGIYAFKYSKRPDTGALDLPDHVDEKIKSERLNNVIEVQEQIADSKNKRYEGSLTDVLVEGVSENNMDKLSGRTETGKVVNFDGVASDIGQIITVRILEAKRHSLTGEKLQNIL